MRGSFVKFSILMVLSFLVGAVSRRMGMSPHQALALGIFTSSICGTLFFWEFRLSFAFLGTCILILTRIIDIEHFIQYSSLEVILFLVGMMIVVGLLKEAGFFAWVVETLLKMRNLTARKFVIAISLISALLSATTGEVVSIIFMVAAILEICDYFEVDPLPYIIISVFTTNIGSAATVLGNPIGILIATKSGLTAEDFLAHALPLSLLCLVATIAICDFWFRKQLKELDKKIKDLGANEILIRLISVPLARELKVALGILGLTVFLITISHRIEVLFNLENNSVLLTIPLIMAAFIMIWKHQKAREFVEKDVEWWSLLFFMFLFAQAGTLKYTGATDVFAQGLINLARGSHDILLGLIVWVASIGSSLMDNVVIVVAFIPIIDSFHALGSGLNSFWWALLFGGCLGGNITLIGSTANIVAIGILEKEKSVKVDFFNWLKIGAVVGLITTAIVWLVLWLVPFGK
ncbi:MAG: SLC13 family permease [Candidatus Omnitrophica bacterium]|nr:SLC13 family permease [Candidatus Omnitrophota bacterium]MDD5574195.1 SLC13 family permease [Candidatus Omnitrophota bacterium]